MEHQYSLRWNNYSQNVSAVFARLRDEELFVDVTLATLDKQVIRAHRVVLSAGSGYLEKILAVNTCEHPTIVLSNLRYKELKLLVDFMYSGEISVDQPLLAGLLEAANWLKIKGLYENKIEEGESSEERESEDENVSETPMAEEDNEPSRKRARSGHEEDEGSVSQSPSTYSEPSSSASLAKPGHGWNSDSVNEAKVDEVKRDNDDIPNILSLANRPTMLQQQQFKSETSKYAEPSMYQNEQMLQAMQVCGSSYLSQLIALQNFSQKPLSSFTGSFTSFAANNATSPPGFKSCLINSTPVRRYKQYSEDSLQAALKEIMEGQSINRSSMKHNIPARTLRDWMKRLNIKSVYTHHSNKDKEGSIGSSSPEPDISLNFDKLRSAVFSGGSNTVHADMDDEDSGRLKIDESCTTLNSVEMAA